MKSENEKLVERYFEYFNNHDWSQMADLYVDKPAVKDPSLGVGIVELTKEDIIEKYSQMAEIFPDVKDDVIQVYPSGDKNIIVEFVSSGTGIDGSTFELPICTIFTIENGKITKDFTYYDNFEDPTEE